MTSQELVDKMKNEKGIKFEYMSEEDAIIFLRYPQSRKLFTRHRHWKKPMALFMSISEGVPEIKLAQVKMKSIHGTASIPYFC